MAEHKTEVIQATSVFWIKYFGEYWERDSFPQSKKSPPLARGREQSLQRFMAPESIRSMCNIYAASL